MAYPNKAPVLKLKNPTSFNKGKPQPGFWLDN
jgi:hypothetical protein